MISNDEKFIYEYNIQTLPVKYVHSYGWTTTQVLNKCDNFR